MACAIEDAGFEVRDMIEWVYGSGFPKSHNIGKAIDKLQGNEREVVGKKRCGIADGPFGSCEEERKHIDETKGTSEWEGWGTALKPAHEPICMARKPLDRWWKIKDDGKKIMGRVMTVAENVLKWGTGGINIDESRVESKPRLTGTLDKGEEIKAEPTSFKGSGTRKLQTGYDEKMLESNLGRFPANLIHDNSEEVRECFPNSGGGKAKHNSEIVRKGIAQDGSSFNAETCGFDVNKCQGMANFGDSGNASRFFKSIIYYPKASKSERNAGLDVIEVGNKRPQGEAFGDGSAITEHSDRKGNFHPTVKPIALMEYLIKMVTSKGGIVLDPFA